MIKNNQMETRELSLQIRINNRNYNIANNDCSVYQRLTLPDIAFVSIKTDDKQIPLVDQLIIITSAHGKIFSGTIKSVRPSAHDPNIHEIQCLDKIENARWTNNPPLYNFIAERKSRYIFPIEPQPISVNLSKYIDKIDNKPIFEDIPSKNIIVEFDIVKLMTIGATLQNSAHDTTNSDLLLNIGCESCNKNQILNLLEFTFMGTVKGFVIKILGILYCHNCGANLNGKKLEALFHHHGGAVDCDYNRSPSCKIVAYKLDETDKFICLDCINNISRTWQVRLHPKAEESFNLKAQELLDQLQVMPDNLLIVPEQAKTPDLYTPMSLTITSEKGTKEAIFIGPNGKEMEVDISHMKVTRFFVDQHGNSLFAVSRYGYKEILFQKNSIQILENLSTDICKKEGFRNIVDRSSIRNLILDWSIERCNEQIATSMTAYIIDKCNELIQHWNIWIPIAKLSVESDIKIGDVVIKPITESLISNWPTEDRIKYQGFAAASVSVYAEKKCAADIAIIKAEQAVSLLSFFSIINIEPEQFLYCNILGREHIASIVYLVIKDGKVNEINTSLADPPYHWYLTSTAIHFIRLHGLDILSKLLLKKRTEFEEALIKSLLLYTKSVLATTIADKLIYILSAIEAFLLIDHNESIQHNLAERIALTIGDKVGHLTFTDSCMVYLEEELVSERVQHKTPNEKVEERKKIISNVKELYKLRSQFIHHGENIEKIEDLAIVKEFMVNVWIFFFYLIKQSSQYNTKKQFYENIEHKKYSS